MWGNPGHLNEMRRKIRMKWTETRSSLPSEFYVLVATTNVDNYTYDGVDHGGERVADEVRLFERRFRRFYTWGSFSEPNRPFVDRSGSGKTQGNGTSCNEILHHRIQPRRARQSIRYRRPTSTQVLRQCHSSQLQHLRHSSHRPSTIPKLLLRPCEFFGS